MDPLLGTIQMFAMNFSPRSWSFCNGALVSISQNTALFSLLGTTFGGDGRNTFALPPLSSRSPMGWSMGGGAGLPQFRWGTEWGMPEKVLTQSELPAHTHSATFTPTGGGGGVEAAEVYATTDPGDSATPSEGAFLAQTDPPGGGQDKPEKIYKSSPTPGSLVSLGGVNGGGGGISGGTVTVGNTGANQSFDLYHPSVAITFSITMQGIYPSRN